ncbi:hypothetical protein NliqN6_3650 [Naganishia liquefaciens]|uniref:Ubiquitin-like domain-containing protein n=1 Tax=Naganishia liquefaciens TaxID=104408 RepID=A0A8H3YFG0_9TREE|nr:hypothetical protein NliqN6_3650 [Naganishia liquefaciens]
MSVSTERLIYDQPPLRPSLEETPDSQQHTPSQSSVPQAASDDQEYFLQEKQEVMSTPVVHPGTEKASLAPEIDAKESVEHVDPLKKAITLEAERMAEHAGPKVRLKILLMNSQNHVYTFEPETSISRVKEALWHLWPADWTSDPARPPSPAYFRLLYMGRMLSDEQTLSGLDMKLAPATTIVHLSVRTIPPEEESNKKSLLGFSLRPSIRGRNSSAGVPSLTSNQPSTSAGPSSQPAPASIPQQRNPAGGAPVMTPTTYNQPTTPVAAQTRSRTGGVDDGTHGSNSSGGGCKCVIM